MVSQGTRGWGTLPSLRSSTYACLSSLLPPSPERATAHQGQAKDLAGPAQCGPCPCPALKPSTPLHSFPSMASPTSGLHSSMPSP